MEKRKTRIWIVRCPKCGNNQKIWTKKDPTPEDALEESKASIKFSKQEAIQIFSPKGMYKVMLFFKHLSSDTFQAGTINAIGRSARDVRRTYGDERNTYIRVVFRDNKLVYYNVWPNLPILRIKRN